MLFDLLMTVIIPLLIGFAVRHCFKKQFEKVLPVFPALSTTFIVFICALVVTRNSEFILQATGPILAAAVILNLGGMAESYGVGAFFKMGVPQKRTLAI